MIGVEDKIAIQELIARFAHCSDYGDWEGLERLYLADTVTELADFGIRAEGIPAQVEHAKKSAQLTNGKNRHFNFNIYIEGEGERALASYFFLNVNAGEAPMTGQLMTSGRIRDTVQKTNDGWKIAHRVVTFDQSFEYPEF